MGDRADSMRVRRNYRHQPDDEDEDDDDTSEDNDFAEEMHEGAGLSAEEKEQALVAMALARIRRAREQGSAEVDLSVGELNAIERHKKRLQMEQRRKRQQEQQEQQRRIVVSLADLEIPGAEDMLPEFPSPNQLRDDPERQGYPPMGYFPPQVSKGRPRSGTASSRTRPPSRNSVNLGRERRDSSPFRYNYIQPHPPTAPRHVSDTAMGTPGNVGPTGEDSWYSHGHAYHNQGASASAPSIPGAGRRPQQQLDPFQYMTPSSRAPYPTDAAPGRRHASGPPGHESSYMYGTGPAPYGGPPAAARGPKASAVAKSQAADDTEGASSEEDDDDTDSGSAGLGQGARISRLDSAELSARGRGRDDPIVVEESPEPEPVATRERSGQRSSKRTAAPSPVKRKPVASGGKRRKGR